MKKLFLLFFIIIAILVPIKVSASDNFEQIMEQELKKIDLNPIEDIYGQYGNKEIFNHKSVREMVLDFATGKNKINAGTFVSYIIKSFSLSIKDNLYPIFSIAFIVILTTLLTNITSDSISGIREISGYVCFIMIFTMLINVFMSYVNLTYEMLDIIKSTSRLIFPPLLTLMTAIGGFSSVSVFKPAVVVLNNSIIELIINGVMPISIVGGTTGILSGINSRIQIKKLSELCSSLCKWTLGIISTVYVGILSIQGAMSSTFDGVSIRTAKYAVDSFIPIIGGMMSDTADTIIGCSLLLKNAIGFTGLLIIVSIALTPIIKIMVCIFAYKLLAAILETVADKKIVDAISSVSNGMTTIFIILLVVISLTFITITLAISAGNTNIMMR